MYFAVERKKKKNKIMSIKIVFQFTIAVSKLATGRIVLLPQAVVCCYLIISHLTFIPPRG
jgi:uncharacterized membrane protein YbaN (DUF454 family)